MARPRRRVKRKTRRPGNRAVRVSKKKTTRRGNRTIAIPLQTTTISIYTSPRLADALEDVARDMTLYQGVRFQQILEAVYKQGKKDGAREAFDELDAHLSQVKQAIPHRGPGRPRRR